MPVQFFDAVYEHAAPNPWWMQKEIAMRTHIRRENLFRTVLYLLTALNVLAHRNGCTSVV